jgi:hypothetical protein
MTYEELIKQAYAYGITVALQEAGYEKTASDAYAKEAAEKADTELVGRILSSLE